MTKKLRPDICVIGGGSGGLTVAAVAAHFGVPVVLVEKGRMGGDCLNYGCVPSKALIAAAKQAHGLRQGSPFGIADVEPRIDFHKVTAHIRSVIAAIAPNDSVERFTAMGVQVIQAEARFVDDKCVVAGEYEIQARRYVVAVGSSPSIPPIPGIENIPFLTNETIFDLAEKPDHLLILGGGPVGFELAQAYHRLGSAVTVIEAGSALGKDDPELAALVLQKLRAEGVVIHEHSVAFRLEKDGEAGVRLYTGPTGAETIIEGSHLLVATGRSPNVERLGLDKASIRFDSKGIKVDDRLRTTNRRVYAIGDVAGGQFTHAANYHAKLAVKSILFRLPVRRKPELIPRVIYTDPEIASVGLSEAQAREANGQIHVLRCPFSEIDRAQADLSTEGFLKLVTCRRGRILGVSIVGSNAGELIGFWSLALAKGMRVHDIIGHIAPYPTMGEIGKRAAITYFKEKAREPLVQGLLRFLRLFG
ncbi:pyruvate/2-oxoglutarate dehydrogenase complex dihydrolipoamide dehydrogenase (E3) component [Mesorhizobium sp. J18]|uniref:dihydrolipoyl dehydrogenase family protein n=1 Tax=Mesorhizobium sp. J18 TaxID=935263 RepID=UPI001199CAA4|nr:FAD-dependent oxidoreductase [Mesorhizobium sp. J18]TWG97506.1 pyruvate/2-oxoglutarate dehydrogenase complex dihydrolipoamide dehydrogenase (E3) component [Mesorhizobium sp. J18]